MKKPATLAIVLIAAAGLSLSACVKIMSSSIANSNKVVQGVTVSAQTTDIGFLELVAPNGLTQNATLGLASQCTSGKFTNATTELSLRDFVIVQLYEIDVSAICQ